MKIFIVLLLIVTVLFSKSKESCYTIQLSSENNSNKNLNRLLSKKYPKECKVMQIGSAITVRCECLETYANAKNKLAVYKHKYSYAKVATTYRSRFSRKKITLKKKKNTTIDKKAINQKDEELRLLMQVFLYKGDMKNAYKVASLGYAKYPNAYYWNEKMFEICKWTNRSARSMKHLRIMYNIKRDPNAEEDLIKYGESTFQYEEIEPLVVNRAYANPSEENIDLMIKIYRKLGYPEKVVSVLDAQYRKDPKNKMLLTKALALSLEMGDLNLAKKYVKILEKEKPYSKKDATLIAKYYYISHDINRGYAALLNVAVSPYDSLEDEKDYYEMKSDLGWYLQRNGEAAEASKALMELNESRLVDYERVSFVYQKSDPELAAEATRRAYSQYALSYLFYSYANSALVLKQFDSLREMIGGIDEKTSPLARESLYWLIKSKVHAHYKEYTLEKEALSKAYDLEPDNMQIKLELLFFYMDQDDTQNIKIILNDMVENPKLKSSAYLSVASTYYGLNDIDRASYYLSELKAINHPATKLIEFQFLEAYIAQSRQNEDLFKSKMIAIEQRLKLKAQKKPRLKKENKYLSTYLRTAMYVINPDKFEKKLKKAKAYLTKKNYDEIAYSWAIRNSAKEKSLQIYNRMQTKELWLEFSTSLVFQNHTKIENVLNLHLNSISANDASSAAHADGQIALSQSMSFESFLNNEKSQSAYMQHLSLSRERSDMLDIKSAYYFREPLLQEYIEIKNRTYLQDGYTLLSHLFYANNKSTNKALYTNVQENIAEIGLGIKRLYNRGEIELSAEYHKKMLNYMEYKAHGKYKISTDIVVGATLSKNTNTAESTQLLLGGRKDSVSMTVSWAILNATTIDLNLDYNEYESQDNVDLGSGSYGRVLIARQFRSGYPDLRVGVFYDRGFYDETEGSRGVIDTLTPIKSKVLPVDFYNVGLSLSYGMANSAIYTRVWRPYIEFSPYYNSDLGNYTYGFNTGVGGKVFHQDHLSIGATYTNSVNGIGGQIWEIYLNYQFMYYHP